MQIVPRSTAQCSAVQIMRCRANNRGTKRTTNTGLGPDISCVPYVCLPGVKLACAAYSDGSFSMSTLLHKTAATYSPSQTIQSDTDDGPMNKKLVLGLVHPKFVRTSASTLRHMVQ